MWWRPKVEFSWYMVGGPEPRSVRRTTKSRPGDLPGAPTDAARHHRCSTINQTRGCFRHWACQVCYPGPEMMEASQLTFRQPESRCECSGLRRLPIRSDAVARKPAARSPAQALQARRYRPRRANGAVPPRRRRARPSSKLPPARRQTRRTRRRPARRKVTLGQRRPSRAVRGPARPDLRVVPARPAVVQFMQR